MLRLAPSQTLVRPLVFCIHFSFADQFRAEFTMTGKAPQWRHGTFLHSVRSSSSSLRNKLIKKGVKVESRFKRAHYRVYGSMWLSCV